jgi:drug/metabolite transporter (DMT)-like permease
MCIVGVAIGERFHAVPATSGLIAFVYLILAGSIVGFSAYIWLLHHVRPVLAGSYAYINPAIAVGLGAWLAHERFGMHEMLAMGVILLGVVAITLAKARAPKPETSA